MLEVCPMTLREANAYIEQYHRHHGPVVGHKFSIGLSDGEKIVGVAIVGHAIVRGGYTDVGLLPGQYGVSWFLTREEAEKALEAMKDG